MAIKLWQVSKIQGHRNPWGKPLTELNAAQLDFILEMEAQDNPRKVVFYRDGKASDGSHKVIEDAAWHDVLVDPVKAGHGPSKAAATTAAHAAAWRARQQINSPSSATPGLKPGFTRGGKPINGV